MKKVLPEKRLWIILLGSIFALSLFVLGFFFSGYPQKFISKPTLTPPPPPAISPENVTKPQSIILKPVGKIEASGSATRMFADNQFLLTITARLPDPPKGKMYQGWIGKNAKEPDFISIGKMEKTADSYNLTFTQNFNLLDSPAVLVTLESSTLVQKANQKPGSRVLEGLF